MKNPIGGKLLSFVFASTLLIASSCKKENEVEPVVEKPAKSSAVFNAALSYGSMTDQDGNVYKTIKIGNQTWMAENLRTTHYRNGDPIPNVKGFTEWTKLSTGAFATFKNTTNKDSIATFGRLYNWYVVGDSRQICPKGWHIPSNEEYTTLIAPLGKDAGGKLKEAGLSHWGINKEGSNASGFTALPSGARGSDADDDDFYNLGSLTEWWNSNEKDANNAWYFDVGNNYSGTYHGSGSKKYGFCIRCLQD